MCVCVCVGGGGARAGAGGGGGQHGQRAGRRARRNTPCPTGGCCPCLTRSAARRGSPQATGKQQPGPVRAENGRGQRGTRRGARRGGAGGGGGGRGEISGQQRRKGLACRPSTCVGGWAAARTSLVRSPRTSEFNPSISALPLSAVRPA